MFDQLKNRYCLSGRLVSDGALHVGSGAPGEEVDMPVMRDRSGRALIPGSSLRGALRSLLERTLAMAAPGRSCTLFHADEEEPCPTANRTQAERIRKLVEEGKAAAARAILLADGDSPGRLCATCRLFGSPFAASKLKVFDLAAKAGEPDRSIRHSVGIDRDEGRARDGILYDYEVLEKGREAAVFAMEISGENLNVGNPDFGLLGVLWTMASKGLTLGAKSGSGMGNCRLILDKVRYFDEGRVHKLRDFLLAESGKEYAVMEPAEFLGLIEGEKKQFLGA